MFSPFLKRRKFARHRFHISKPLNSQARPLHSLQSSPPNRPPPYHLLPSRIKKHVDRIHFQVSQHGVKVTTVRFSSEYSLDCQSKNRLNDNVSAPLKFPNDTVLVFQLFTLASPAFFSTQEKLVFLLSSFRLFYEGVCRFDIFTLISQFPRLINSHVFLPLLRFIIFLCFLSNQTTTIKINYDKKVNKIIKNRIRTSLNCLFSSSDFGIGARSLISYAYFFVWDDRGFVVMFVEFPIKERLKSTSFQKCISLSSMIPLCFASRLVLMYLSYGD